MSGDGSEPHDGGHLQPALAHDLRIECVLDLRLLVALHLLYRYVACRVSIPHNRQIHAASGEGTASTTP